MHLVVIGMIFLIGCVEQVKSPCFVIADSVRVEQRKFVIDCVTGSNPKSDEEPEDWIHECTKSSIALYGTLRGGNTGRWTQGNYASLCTE